MRVLLLLLLSVGLLGAAAKQRSGGDITDEGWDATMDQARVSFPASVGLGEAADNTTCTDVWHEECEHLADHCATALTMKVKCRKTCHLCDEPLPSWHDSDSMKQNHTASTPTPAPEPATAAPTSAPVEGPPVDTPDYKRAIEEKKKQEDENTKKEAEDKKAKAEQDAAAKTEEDKETKKAADDMNEMTKMQADMEKMTGGLPKIKTPPSDPNVTDAMLSMSEVEVLMQLEMVSEQELERMGYRLGETQKGVKTVGKSGQSGELDFASNYHDSPYELGEGQDPAPPTANATGAAAAALQAEELKQAQQEAVKDEAIKLAEKEVEKEQETKEVAKQAETQAVAAAMKIAGAEVKKMAKAAAEEETKKEVKKEAKKEAKKQAEKKAEKAELKEVEKAAAKKAEIKAIKKVAEEEVLEKEKKKSEDDAKKSAEEEAKTAAQKVIADGRAQEAEQAKQTVNAATGSAAAPAVPTATSSGACADTGDWASHCGYLVEHCNDYMAMKMYCKGTCGQCGGASAAVTSAPATSPAAAAVSAAAAAVPNELWW